MLLTHPDCFAAFPSCICAPKIFNKITFLRFWKNVISEPPGPQIELRIAVSDFSRCRRPVWITFGRFRKNHFSTIFLRFARVTFQFSAQGLQARKVSADMNAVSGRNFRGLVGPRAVLAGVAEKPLKSRLEHLNATLAVGPSFFRDRPPEESASHHFGASQASD